MLSKIWKAAFRTTNSKFATVSENRTPPTKTTTSNTEHLQESRPGGLRETIESSAHWLAQTSQAYHMAPCELPASWRKTENANNQSPNNCRYRDDPIFSMSHDSPRHHSTNITFVLVELMISKRPEYGNVNINESPATEIGAVAFLTLISILEDPIQSKLKWRIPYKVHTYMHAYIHTYKHTWHYISWHYTTLHALHYITWHT